MLFEVSEVIDWSMGVHNSDSDKFKISANSGVLSGGNVFTIETGGNVGIGTTAPNQELTIEGTMSLKEQASADGDTAAYGQVLKTNSSGTLSWTTAGGHSFVDVGDVVAHVNLGAAFQIGTWRDLDLSTYVPEGTVAVLVAVTLSANDASCNAAFRKKGCTNIYNILSAPFLVDDETYVLNGWIALGSDRTIEVNVSDTNWTAAYIVVRGWLI